MSNPSPGLWSDTDPMTEESSTSDAAPAEPLSSTEAEKAAEPEALGANQPATPQDSLVKAATDATPAPKKSRSSSDKSPPAKSEAAKAEPTKSESATGGEKMSKSRRIREYLEAHPDARNRDVVTALEPFGVKAADVANVKAQQKQRSGAEPAAAADGQPDAKAAPVAKRGRPKGARKARSASATPAPAAKRTSSAARATSPAEIGLSEVDAAIQFIEQAGGIERARQIIDLVDRIRQMNIG